jgi:starch synthase
MPKTSVLFAASEVYPFVKTGGLADVAFALPRALKEELNISVVLPLYQSIDTKQYGIRAMGEPVSLSMGTTEYAVQFLACEYEGITYSFVQTPCLSEREFIYGTPEAGYVDNDIRFGLFSVAVYYLLQTRHFDVVHLNDWQSAMVALWLKDDTSLKTKSVFTIHNLAYQGLFPKTALENLGLKQQYYHMDALEFYDQVSFMKAGIAYADAVTTVSEQYAKEIQTEAFGCGLEGFLRWHADKLTGITNGIDTQHFSPKQDAALIHPYESYEGKAANKVHLCEQYGFDANLPLMIFIGRLTYQKGIELLLPVLADIASTCSVIVLGEGEEQYADQLHTLAQSHNNIVFIEGYDEQLSHQLYAGADFLLMPSRFEPCGLNQLISFAYGTIPVVHHVGGLVDTVNAYETFDTKNSGAFGIVFKTASATALKRACKKAMALYDNTEQLAAIAVHNMHCDVSWKQSAQQYSALYESLLGGEKE